MEQASYIRLKALLERYLADRLSPVEVDELAGYAADPAFADTLRELLGEAFHAEASEPMDALRRREVIRHVTGRPPAVGARRRPWVRRWLPYAAAAVVAAAVTWFSVHRVSRNQAETLAAADIQPGGNRATLTLADGRTIDLSEAQQGIIVGEEINYTDGSAVLSDQVNEGTSEPVGGAFPSSQVHRLTSSQYTLSTPKGGTYQITLPDGSRVWLNANSTLKYPARFAGDERVVELTGEAYFDISEQVNEGTGEQAGGTLQGSQAHRLTNSQKVPFKVISNGQTVEVLGTEFNISAYPDEPETRTTLVEGKVRVEATGASVSLVPGEQGTLTISGLTTQHVDVTLYTVWKDGRFSFRDKPFEQLMRELARWYDLDVEYEGTIPEETFFGGAFRDSNLSIVLALLESAKIQYKIDPAAKKLTIINQKEVGMK